MSTNIAELIKLRNLASVYFRRKHTIILNPEEDGNKEDLNANIECDKAKWKIKSDEIRAFVDQLSQNSQLSDEDKILSVYQKLCESYVYDDNLISYIQKIDDDSFYVPDEYGRAVDQEWEKNREQHNRRVCFELARYLAKALTELFKDKENFNVCILYDKGLTHYFVGLTCNEYSITLDLDDFNNIKDLTRVKTGLTVEGIRILDDSEGKFADALGEFNKGRGKDAIKKIEDEIASNDTACLNPNAQNQDSNQIGESDDIVFLRNAIEILKEKYKIDSQGLFECIKEIVDIKLGPEARSKKYKILKGNDNEATRYIRCLVLKVENQKYIIDVDEMLLRPYDKRKDTVYISSKGYSRDWENEPYDGT